MYRIEGIYEALNKTEIIYDCTAEYSLQASLNLFCWAQTQPPCLLWLLHLSLYVENKRLCWFSFCCENGAGSWLNRLDLINKSGEVKETGWDCFVQTDEDDGKKISHINWLDTQG